MTVFLLLVVAILLVSLGGGMIQALRGPTRGDRMLVVQLLGTGAVAVLVLLAEAGHDPALVDIALVLALLAAITMVAFVRCAWPLEDADEPGS